MAGRIYQGYLENKAKQHAAKIEWSFLAGSEPG
jgi:hypothetical protein